jgi:hypothetical protein
VIEVLGFYERNLGIQRSRTSRNKHECEQLKEQKNELISVQLFSKLQVNTQTAIIMIIIYKIKEKSGWPSTYVLGIPRDGTSCCPFVPVQKYFLVSLSFCPGTRAGAKILGQTPLSWDVPGQNHFAPKTKKKGKGRSKTGKRHSKTKRMY